MLLKEFNSILKIKPDYKSDNTISVFIHNGTDLTTYFLVYKFLKQLLLMICLVWSYQSFKDEIAS